MNINNDNLKEIRNLKEIVDKYENKLVFLPLGGVGEIGANMTLVHYAGNWILIDAGIGFSGPDLPGTDLKIPDISFLSDIKENLIAIFLTHAHEDHVGALTYLLDKIDCPIYASRFTIEAMKVRLPRYFDNDTVANSPDLLADNDQDSKYGSSSVSSNIVLLKSGEVIKVGDFEVEPVNVTHSIPDSLALYIRTAGGSFFHSGDWKFDENPVIGSPTDKKRLKEIGKLGVDIMLCDSTNITRESKSPEEKDLIPTIGEIFKKNTTTGIFVTLFASNVARVKIVADLAKEHGRKVVLIGSSLARMLKASSSIGYLDESDFISIDDAISFPRDRLCAICTGCQAEPMAAMSRMVFQRDKQIAIEKEDVVVFSSAMIPGNEYEIYKLVNQIIDIGGRVYYEKGYKVHVSGHSSYEEMQELYSLIKPKHTLPMHGEHIHLELHHQSAKKWGFESTKIKNGHVVVVEKREDNSVSVSINDFVRSEYYGIDGRFFRTAKSSVMEARNRMKDNGIIVITVILDSETSKQVIKQPLIYAPGVLDINEDRDLLASMSSAVKKALNNKAIQKDERRIKATKDSISRAIKGICRREIGKNPEIKVQVEYIRKDRS